MGYREAIKAAGVTVKAFESFGSWQGDWLAYIGEGRFIHGAFGSCSVCDAFQAEFGYHQVPVVGERDWDTDAVYTQEDVDAYNRRLAAFGARYVHANNLTLEEIEKEYGPRWEDDDSHEEIVKWARERVKEDSK